MSLTILIPAHNEADGIRANLGAVLSSAGLTKIEKQILVLANGCTDATVAISESFREQAEADGWAFDVVEVEAQGKLNALNVGDAQAKGEIRIYLDADVVISPGLVRAICHALSDTTPAFASGLPVVTATSGFTALYARFWQKLPFFTQTVPGFGVFAVNASGRSRWQNWPDIIADDLFARLNFAPSERVKCGEPYLWPMVEGFASLVRVRRRQDAGVREITALFPELIANEDKSAAPILRLAGKDPVGFLAYACVALCVRLPLFKNTDKWQRGP